MARLFRRVRRGDAEYVWCALQSLTNSLSSTVAEEHLLVTGPDWFGGAGGGEATLLRIRASLGYMLANETLASGYVQVAIYKTKATAIPYAVPWGVASLVDEDVLYYKVFAQGTGPGGRVATNLDIDVKAKRKIDSNDDIRLMIATVGAAATYHIASRALVKV